MSMQGLTKSSATTLTPLSRTATTMTAMIRAGQGWKYDETGILYDGPSDPSGREILYNSVGSETVMAPLAKNNA